MDPKKKVLLIEDDIQLQDIYNTTLSKEGYEVLLATNGQNGLSLATSQKPNIILLDIMLPGEMNGFDVLEKIKGFNETKEIPVIVFTNLDSEKAQAMQLGAKAYLVKVNTPTEEVIKYIKEYIS